MNILIAGGAGYIGSHVVRYLLETGQNPIVFDNLSNGHRDAVSGVGFGLNDDQRRDGDPVELVADSTLAGQELGWEPRFTGLSQTFERPSALEEARWAAR